MPKAATAIPANIAGERIYEAFDLPYSLDWQKKSGTAQCPLFRDFPQCTNVSNVVGLRQPFLLCSRQCRFLYRKLERPPFAKSCSIAANPPDLDHVHELRFKQRCPFHWQALAWQDGLQMVDMRPNRQQLPCFTSVVDNTPSL